MDINLVGYSYIERDAEHHYSMSDINILEEDTHLNTQVSLIHCHAGASVKLMKQLLIMKFNLPLLRDIYHLKILDFKNTQCWILTSDKSNNSDSNHPYWERQNDEDIVDIREHVYQTLMIIFPSWEDNKKIGVVFNLELQPIPSPPSSCCIPF